RQSVPRRERSTWYRVLHPSHHAHFLAVGDGPVDQVHREGEVCNRRHICKETPNAAVTGRRRHFVAETTLAAGRKAVGTADDWSVLRPADIVTVIEIVGDLSVCGQYRRRRVHYRDDLFA